MDLHIYISTTKALSFHVCIYICDILPHRNNQTQLSVCTLEVTLWNSLEEHVYDEILELNTHILDTLPEEEDCPFLKHDTTKL